MIGLPFEHTDEDGDRVILLPLDDEGTKGAEVTCYGEEFDSVTVHLDNEGAVRRLRDSLTEYLGDGETEGKKAEPEGDIDTMWRLPVPYFTEVDRTPAVTVNVQQHFHQGSTGKSAAEAADELVKAVSAALGRRAAFW